MDFYAAQDLARRNSRWLLLAFIIAVLVLIGITNVLVAGVVFFSDFRQTSGQLDLGAFKAAFSWERFGFISFAVTSTVFVVVLFKWAQLSAGGKVVAEHLGGERILPHTENREQRRCLNVVEEMALAAGLPVPPVYLLPTERGINAFAAGTSPADAVIGITQGSLDRFNREQLQGVVAHEYSHILNGDMRLNIRLAALLKGITFIGDVGEVILRGGSRRNRRYSSADVKISYPTIVAGLGLYLVGLLGGIFAGLIKAAVSRQREHLADASAVQFTRNPKGVADALKVIGGHIPGSVIVEVHANELSHIFFGQIGSPLLLWFKTHPPLPERIRRIEPDWDGQYIHPDPEEAYKGTQADQLRREQHERAAGVATAAVIAGAVMGGAEDAEFSPAPPVEEPAENPAAAMPTSLSDQAHDPFGSHAVALGLLLAAEADVRENQYQLIEASGVRGLATTTRQLYPEIEALPRDMRLSLLELSLPALKCMSPPQYKTFKETMLKVTRADNKVDLYEWCLYQVVRHYLDPEFIQVTPSKPRHRKPVHVRQSFRTVVSVLAWHGHDNDEDREAAFTRGVESVGLYNLNLRPLEECSVAEFSKAVNQLADCYPLLKPRLLKGMAKCAALDGELLPREVEILVAVAAVMDCPVPASIRASTEIPE